MGQESDVEVTALHHTVKAGSVWRPGRAVETSDGKPTRMKTSAVLAVLLSLLSSGCVTRRLMSIGAGVDWFDEYTPPPQSRIVPDRIAFCADGNVEILADAFVPPDVQWRNHAEVPVRVWASLAFPDPGKVPPFGIIEYRDLRDGTCGPVAETARITLSPDRWRAVERDGAACTRRVAQRLLRDQAFASDGTTPVAPELLDAVPARSIEVVVPRDHRAPVRLKEPSRAVYAALPVAVATDGALVGSGSAIVLGAAAGGLALTPGYLLLGAPFFVAGKIQQRFARPRSKNLAGRDLTRERFPRSDALAGANLRCAKLLAMDLRDARLADADLENARLVDADLRGADLSHVRNLTQRQLDFACVDAATRLPPGLTAPPPCH
jgi:hypothetical protein